MGTKKKAKGKPSSAAGKPPKHMARAEMAKRISAAWEDFLKSLESRDLTRITDDRLVGQSVPRY